MKINEPKMSAKAWDQLEQLEQVKLICSEVHFIQSRDQKDTISKRDPDSFNNCALIFKTGSTWTCRNHSTEIRIEGK